MADEEGASSGVESGHEVRCAGCKGTDHMAAKDNFHKCRVCTQPVHSYIVCQFVHQGEEEGHHVCEACHTVVDGKGKRAISPACLADAQLLVDVGSGGQGRNSLAAGAKAPVQPAASIFHSAARISKPNQHGIQPRVAAVHTPRPQHALLQAPPVGTTWVWEPQIISADGADAGPNGVIDTVRQGNAAYNPLRGHCSVHKQRNVQQNRTKIFQGDHDEKESKSSALTTLMEQVKAHSITVSLAQLGKRKITEHLEETDGEESATYFRKHHQDDKWTLAEMNEDTAAGGGVPVTSAGIERNNLEQKVDHGWKRVKVIPFMQQHAEQLGQKSMDDLQFGLKMPRGYKKPRKTSSDGHARPAIDKTVWSVSFFDNVKFEVAHPAGIQHLTWKASLTGYHSASLIMSSRKMRAWVLTDHDFAVRYSQSDDKKKCMKQAMADNTVLDGQRHPSFVKQFQRIVKGVNSEDLSLCDLIEWQQCFHILQPITCPIYVDDLLKRLRYSGLELKEEAVQRVTTEEGKGDTKTIYMYKCSCALYKHYAWCIHVMLRAVQQGLVVKPYCPPSMDSAQVALPGKEPKVGTGRPKKARKGGALSQDED